MMGRIGACLLVVTLKGRSGWTGVPKPGDEEGASAGRGTMPQPVNIAPAMSLCFRRLLGLRFMAARLDTRLEVRKEVSKGEVCVRELIGGDC